MITVLCVLCVLLAVILLLTCCKIISLRTAAAELRRQVAERAQEDTNVGIDTASSDGQMKKLAAVLDRQQKLSREEHLRYKQGDHELKEAVTNISHDLRTPLTAICGYMELLEEEEVSARVREYLEIIANRIAVLKELTEELFRYSVIMSQEENGKREEVSLNRILEECMAGYYAAFCAADIVPEIILPETEIKRETSRQALSRILANVISNAIKYSDGDFKAELGTDGTLHFYNHARKLDTVEVGHLFERFYTVENGKNATGLGLSIARTLAEEIGGNFEAEYAEGVLHMWFEV